MILSLLGCEGCWWMNSWNWTCLVNSCIRQRQHVKSPCSPFSHTSNLKYCQIGELNESSMSISRTFGCCCGCPNLEGHCKHLLRVAKPHHWHAFVQVVFEYSLQVRILCFPNTNNKKRRQWGAVLSVQPSMQAESKQAHQYIDLIHGKTTHWSSSLAELEAFKKECVCQPAGR